LNRHPHIACGPESKFAQHPSFVAWHERISAEWSERVERFGLGADAVDRCFAALVDDIFMGYARREGKQRWAEKTPTNILRIDFLFRLFPRAQFVHVIRDPRDAYCSIRDRMHSDKPRWLKFDPARSAEDWRASIEAGQRWRPAPERYLEIRYEELVQEPEGVMRRVLRFLDEPWDPRILQAEADNQEVRGGKTRRVRGQIFATSIGRWRRDLNTDEVSAIEAIAGPLMADLGYPPVRES
jgi:hypothetical protein